MIPSLAWHGRAGHSTSTDSGSDFHGRYALCLGLLNHLRHGRVPG